MADSRSLVYTSGASHGSLGQAMTMINFDNFIRFELGIPSSSTAPKRSYTFKDAQTDIRVEELREKMEGWRNAVWSEAAWTIQPTKWVEWSQGMASWMWYERTWAYRGVGGEYIVQRK